MYNIVYIATSIDGYIARKDGGIDWLMDLPNPDNSDYGFSDFIERIDGILMGRNTFETAAGFSEWPYTKPVYVLSNSLTQLPVGLSSKAEIVKGNFEDILVSLQNKGVNKLYIDGGKTIQSFLQQDMVDEMVITRIPVLLGSGIPLFDNLSAELKFEHQSTQVYNNMLVKSSYTRKR